MVAATKAPAPNGDDTLAYSEDAYGRVFGLLNQIRDRYTSPVSMSPIVFYLNRILPRLLVPGTVLERHKLASQLSIEPGEEAAMMCFQGAWQHTRAVLAGPVDIDLG